MVIELVILSDLSTVSSANRSTEPALETDLHYQQQFFKDLLTRFKLDSSNPHHLYFLTKEVVIENGGEKILNLYNGSLHRTLKNIFPGYHSVAKDIPKEKVKKAI